MAASAKETLVTNGTHTPGEPIELAITLPRSPGTRIHVHLTILPASLMLFLTSSSMDTTAAQASMGSFVYAIPDRYNPSQSLSTPLYTLPSSLDFATRLAKVLARKAMRPCYVGNSINLAGAAGGGTVEEEMDAFRAVVMVVMRQLEKEEEEEEEDG